MLIYDVIDELELQGEGRGKGEGWRVLERLITIDCTVDVAYHVQGVLVRRES